MKEKKENILDIIKKLSDLQFQEDVWLKGKYWDRILNFGEAVNTLDDYCFFDDIESVIIKLIKDTDQKKLKQFEKDLLNYQEDILNPEKMLKDTKWINITKKAKEIYVLLSDIVWN